jgi:hypothetical protein
MGADTPRAALAFSPHSGWAAVVVLAGPVSSPRVLERGRIEMAAPDLPGSKQPYHAVESLPLADAERRLALLSDSARRLAADALGAVVSRVRAGGFSLGRSGILDASGRKGATLAATLASHALIHTADGDHFRDALAAAARRHGLAVVRVRQRELADRAASALGRSAARLTAAVAQLGRPLGPPWGADQKMAALLAWTLLGP